MRKGEKVSKMDIHPDQIYLTSKQYDAIKNQQPNIPFKIEDNRIADQLLEGSLIKERKIKVCEEFRLDDKVMSRYVDEFSGEYLLTTEGEYYIDYRKSHNTNHFWNEFRAWVTLLIAVLGVGVPIISLLINTQNASLVDKTTNNIYTPKNPDDFFEEDSNEEIDNTDEFYTDIKVRLADCEDKTWRSSIYANVGDIVEFQIQYINIGNESHFDVAVRDVLSQKLKYIDGSTKLYNTNYPDGAKVDQDSVTNNGINIGNYAAGANAFIRFRAEVIGDNLAEGVNLLYNWGQVQAGSAEQIILQDDACVIVNHYID